MAVGILAQTPNKRTLLEQLARSLEETAAALREVSVLPEPTRPEPAGDGGPQLLSAKCAVAYLGVSRTHFWRLRREPGFPAAVQMAGGSGLRYRRSDLESWVAGLQGVRR